MITASALGLAIPAHAESVADWRPFITEASLRFRVPSAWIERVIWAESRGHAMLGGRPIRSRAGAMGLMQLMPATWAEMRARLGLGRNPDDPRDNILAGTLYLRLMYDRFGYPGLFGAYNAGPGAYAAWLAGKRQLSGETVAYLETVGGARQPAIQYAPAAPRPTLFIVRRAAPFEPLSAPPREPQVSLFAIRNVTP